MITEFDAFSNQVLSALGNGVYQGILLSIAVWIGLKAFPGVNAATRYAVELSTLLIIAVLPVGHFLLSHPRPLPAPQPETVVDPSPTETHFAPEPADVIDLPQSTEFAVFHDDDAPSAVVQGLILRALTEATLEQRSESKVAPAESPAETSALTVSPRTTDRSSLQEPDPASSPAASSGPSTATAGPVHGSKPASNFNFNFADLLPSLSALPSLPERWRHWQPSIPTSASLVLVGLWLAVAGSRFIHLVVQCRALQRMKQQGRRPHEALSAMVQQLRDEMGVRRKVGISLDSNLSSPVAVGFWSPAVLLPAGLESAPRADLERILRHELAHIERRDDWTNLVQQVIRAVLFFHPSVWWLSQRLTVDREIACDDHVIAGTRSRRDYALFLADFASRTQGRAVAAAPAAWCHNSQLKERINMIMDSKRNASPRLARTRAGVLSAAATVFAAAGLLAGPRLALAGDDSSEDQAVALPTPPAEVVAINIDPPNVEARVTTSSDLHVNLDEDSGNVLILTPPTPTAPAKVKSAVQARSPRNVNVHVDVQPPTPATVLVAPRPGHPAIVAHAAPVPTPPSPAHSYSPARVRVDSPRMIAQADRDLERRIERLERLIESMAGGPKEKDKGQGDGWEKEKENNNDKEKDKAREEAEKASREAARGIQDQVRELEAQMKREFKGKFEGKSFENFMKDHAQLFGGEFVDKMLPQILEQVSKQVELATREAERAAEHVRRAAAEFQAKARGGEAKGLEAQRQALEKQRRELERHIGEIEAKLERLDSNLDGIDDALDSADDQLDRVEEEQERREEELQRREEERQELEEERKQREEERRQRDEERRQRDQERAKENRKPVPAPAPQAN